MTCAFCKHFSIKDDPEKGGLGFGKCSGFVVGLHTFVEWNDPDCRSYRPAMHMMARENYVKEQRKRVAESAKEEHQQTKFETAPITAAISEN